MGGNVWADAIKEVDPKTAKPVAIDAAVLIQVRMIISQVLNGPTHLRPQAKPDRKPAADQVLVATLKLPRLVLKHQFHAVVCGFKPKRLIELAGFLALHVGRKLDQIATVLSADADHLFHHAGANALPAQA